MAGPFGYFIIDVKTRKTIAICIVIIIVMFALGIAIGYVSGKKRKSTGNNYVMENFSGEITKACFDSFHRTNTTRMYMKRYFETNTWKYRCVDDSDSCWDSGLPRHYIAYHLEKKIITMDGKLDEEAWSEIPWSDTFVDLRSKSYPDPDYVTKFKMRWNNDRLYIGAYLQEKELWATFTSHDSKIWTENGFDILLDVDGSMFNYKQIEINVRGAMMDLLMYKSYWDADGKKVHNMRWDSGAKRGVYYEGTINLPSDKDKYWSFELSIPFKKLAEKSRRFQPYPTDNEVWFAEFARPQQNLLVNEKGQYEKDPNGSPFWWAWQPCYTLHGHLQDRWGLVQFKRTRTDKIFRFERWHIYKALFDMLNAMKQYKAINGFYTDEIEELDVPPYLLTRACVDIPQIDISKGSGSSSVVTQQKSVTEAIMSSCRDTTIDTSSGKLFLDRYVERHSEKNICLKSPVDCWDFGLPRHYIAYHLDKKSITIDGKLDEEAWNEVPWSEDFVDMRSTVYPKPYLNTKFKMRWDNDRMYVGAYIEEKNLWATLDTHDSPIWKENGFELLMDVDGSMFNYKQVQINVLGTMMDQILYKSPWDAANLKVNSKQWHPDAKKKVHVEGTINTPGDEDKYWSVEMSFSFANLAENSQRVQPVPSDNEVWFLQFGRSEQNLTVVDGKYMKVPESKPDWWSWGPCDAINLHLQDRWGLIQFKKNMNEKKFRFGKWHIYKSLFDMMDAMNKYKAINGRYTTAIEELDVPPYLLSRTCVDIPKIELFRRENETILDVSTDPVSDFNVTVQSMFLSHKPAHIRSDRYVTFK